MGPHLADPDGEGPDGSFLKPKIIGFPLQNAMYTLTLFE